MPLRTHAWLELDAAGTRMRARVWNPEAAATRLPVVLVHGLVISSAYMAPLGARLGQWLPVWAPDLPGFGRSAPPPSPLDIDGLADALAAWMDAAGIARASVVANSMGCQVAVALATRHPSRVDRLALVGPTVDAAARTMPRQIARLVRMTTRERWTLPLLEAADLLRAGPARAWRTARAALADSIETRAPHVRQPVLVLRGHGDAIAPHDWAAALARYFPAGEHATVAGGHALNYSHPDALARELLAFLEVARPLPAPPPLPIDVPSRTFLHRGLARLRDARPRPAQGH